MTRDRAWEVWAETVGADPFGESRGTPEQRAAWCTDGCDQPVADCAHSIPDRSGETADRAAIAATLLAFNADEVATIRRLCDRLMLGRTRYQPLDLAADPRMWEDELDEEVDDALIYAAFGYLKRRLRRRGP